MPSTASRGGNAGTRAITIDWVRSVASYRLLLSALAVLLLVYPILSKVSLLRGVLDLIVCFVLLTGVLSATRSRSTFFVSAALASAMVVLDWLSEGIGESWLQGASLLCGCLFFSFVVAILLRSLFIESVYVNADTIYGAISAYLLLGLAFAFLFMFLDFVDTDSFPHHHMLSGSATQMLEGYMYFSFVTLTSLGFGDISPGTPQAGAFVTMETVLGQLYLTVLIARLVGLHTSRNLDRGTTDHE